MAEEIAVNDRVKRTNAYGCVGVVTDIREELVPARSDKSNKALLCKVRWDDGVHSYYDLNNLEKIKA